MIFPASIFESISENETLDEKSKFIRFEHISEIFTYTALIAGITLTFLPFQYSFERVGLYVFTAAIAVFSIFWFRLLPKKYSGKTKNIIYYSLSVIFVGVVVYFTRGIQSPVIFLFYLTCLAVAASMGIKQTLLFTGFSAVIILSQVFANPTNLPLSQGLSLALLHIWGLITTVVFGWFIFREEKISWQSHQEAHLKKMREINQIKDEFVFIISSKLASPIVTLREFITMTLIGKFGELSADQKDVLIKTEENSRRLELLVGDMLDLSKIETGSLRLKLEKVDIGNLISATLSDFSLKASEKRISLLFDNPKSKVFILADSARLHEVAANIVDNAIKYSPHGSRVKVTILEKGNFVQAAVNDNGLGISEKAQEHLFEKFYRVNNEKGKVRGSGLGLFISKQLIERQGGKIWCRSKKGEGSTFSFGLPRYKNG